MQVHKPCRFPRWCSSPKNRVFVVKTYHETRSIIATQNAFRNQFPLRAPPSKKAIWDNVKKFQQHGTSLNRSNGHSGRRRTVRTQQNIAAVRQVLQNRPQNVSARRNGLGLSKDSFNRITRHDLGMHPYHIHPRHELLPGDLPRLGTRRFWHVIFRTMVLSDALHHMHQLGTNGKQKASAFSCCKPKSRIFKGFDVLTHYVPVYFFMRHPVVDSIYLYGKVVVYMYVVYGCVCTGDTL